MTRYDTSKDTHDMTKSANANAMIALKTMHDDIVKSNPTFTRTTKQMRVALRATFADIHDKNSSWSFTQSQYDRVRSHFDPAYATKIARASKRNAKSNATPRVRKSRKLDASSNANVINNELHDA